MRGANDIFETTNRVTGCVAVGWAVITQVNRDTGVRTLVGNGIIATAAFQGIAFSATLDDIGFPLSPVRMSSWRLPMMFSIPKIEPLPRVIVTPIPIAVVINPVFIGYGVYGIGVCISYLVIDIPIPIKVAFAVHGCR